MESFIKESAPEEVKELFTLLHISKARAKKLISRAPALPNSEPATTG